MDYLLQNLVSGLTVGSTYALIAVGYALIWSTIRTVNFAFGDVYTIGAYCALGIAVLLGTTNVWLVLGLITLVSLIAGAALSMAIELSIFAPLRPKNPPDTIPILATIGASLIIQYTIYLTVGPAFQAFPTNIPRGEFTIGDGHFNTMQLCFIVGTVLVISALNLFMTKTKLGTAMRASAWDQETASIMGVNVHVIILIAFAAAGALGGIAGGFAAYYYGVITFFMGFSFAVKGFTAAVIGGFDNVRGALIGGLLLGVLEAMVAGYLSSTWKDGIAFIVLIIVILFKPTGIFGERMSSKV